MRAKSLSEFPFLHECVQSLQNEFARISCSTSNKKLPDSKLHNSKIRSEALKQQPFDQLWFFGTQRTFAEIKLRNNFTSTGDGLTSWFWNQVQDFVVQSNVMRSWKTINTWCYFWSLVSEYFCILLFMRYFSLDVPKNSKVSFIVSGGKIYVNAQFLEHIDWADHGTKESY